MGIRFINLFHDFEDRQGNWVKIRQENPKSLRRRREKVIKIHFPIKRNNYISFLLDLIFLMNFSSNFMRLEIFYLRILRISNKLRALWREDFRDL